MFVIKERYSKIVMLKCATYDEAMKWIGDCAEQMNYGIYRKWPEEDHECFDCGPKVYIVEEVDD